MGSKFKQLLARLQRIEDTVDSTEGNVTDVEYRLEQVEYKLDHLLSLLEDDPETRPEEDQTNE